MVIVEPRGRQGNNERPHYNLGCRTSRKTQ
jgi:hypothetical protein